jgi:hypothetical protein
LRKCSNNFQDFNEAKYAVSFFINASIPDDYGNVVDISFDNINTNEKLVIKKVNTGDEELGMLLIWRYPLKAAKKWIDANEKEIMADWNNEELNRKITLPVGLTIAI